MAYSYDDHILDHIELDLEVPYVYYQKVENKFKISNTNLKDNRIQESNLIVQDILYKY